MPTTDLAVTLTNARNSRTTISASASARIRREATRANVPRDTGSVSMVERAKVTTFTYTEKRLCEKKNLNIKISKIRILSGKRSTNYGQKIGNIRSCINAIDVIP